MRLNGLHVKLRQGEIRAKVRAYHLCELASMHQVFDVVFLVTNKADGSGAKQITNFGCASFAPQFTPDSKKIIFASNKNKCDSREFELFLIDADGGNLRQVTSYGGFTSFPDFSPDGRRLAFTSSWKAKSPYEFRLPSPTGSRDLDARFRQTAQKSQNDANNLATDAHGCTPILGKIRVQFCTITVSPFTAFCGTTTARPRSSTNRIPSTWGPFSTVLVFH